VIGPSDAGTDVNVVLSRAPAVSTTRERADGPTTPVGSAHINRWRLNDRGATPNDAAARLIAGELERQPGFLSYALVRTDAREVVAITIFETETELRRAMEAVAPLVRRHVRPLAAAGPEHREGDVLHYRAR
jgi:heme-degrading monooxygenase HmoA